MYRLHRSLHNDDHGQVSFYDLIRIIALHYL
jgi:hypothetical protein